MSTLNEIEQLLKFFNLETIEENIYRGQSLDIGTGRIFGGQVLGQALAAASRTVPEDRQAHSLHAYFLREGDCNKPVVFTVDRARDGRSFSNRRVVAIQYGRPILNLAASFKIDETGFAHQIDMPSVPFPEELHEKPLIPASKIKHLSPRMRRTLTTQGPLEIRPVTDIDPFDTEPKPPIKQLWFRARYPVPDDRALQRVLLAFVSDYHLVNTATHPHGISYLDPTLQIASLDHAMWFHRDFRIDDWLLYDCDSPVASNATALAIGRIFNREGVLVATTAQEGLMRKHDKPRPPHGRQA